MAKYDPDEFFNRKKPTNGDKLRAMTDEQWANWYANKPDCCPPGRNPAWMCDENPDNCFACWLDWLKSPVEGLE